MPLNAGEKADEGMIPRPFFVRMMPFVFFAEEDDED